jgi:putative endopeptidase
METRITHAYTIRNEINKELDAIVKTEISRAPAGIVATLASSVAAAAAEPIPSGLSALIQMMLSVSTPRDIVAQIGWMNKHGIKAPLSISIHGDPHDRRRCRVYIEDTEPMIGSDTYWTWPEYASHRAAYATYVKSLAALTGVPALRRGYTAERDYNDLVPISSEETRAFSWSDLTTEFRHIDWAAMLGAWGIVPAELRDLTFILSDREFIHSFQRRLQVWSAERWAGWLALMVTQWYAGCSPHGPLRSAWFTYSRRYLQGSLHDESAHSIQRAILYSVLPNTIGRLWVDRYCDPAVKRTATKMVGHIRNAAIDLIRVTPWMSPSTREAAVHKLRKMEVQICYPERSTWSLTAEKVSLSSSDLVGNYLTLSAISTMESQKQQRCDRLVSAEKWGRPVFEVNAFYYPDENRFLLPAAILRAPFYDATRSPAWNYGAIGATIGHEFCHAFDAEGRHFDENGNKRDWWTPHDDREYRKRAGAVVRLYASTEYRGMKVNGKQTLVENIADIGGLEFALAGLRQDLGRHPTCQELREFFTSYSESWRSKDRLRRAAELLAVDSHAPPMLRVNNVVRQMDDWYTAFGLDPSCEGYIPPAKRIHFFGATATA